ncbi:MAG TPA: hypothetical protein VM142_11730 [Acidimicrobiales bacterium]|nr:hypothetical protein [Acidimicrobiales bacterium]
MVQVRTGVGLLAAAASAVALVALASPAGASSAAPQIISSPAPDPGNDTTPTWAFSVDNAGQLSCRLTGPGRPDAYTDCASPIIYDLAGHADGTYTFAVRRQPSNANSDETAATSTYTLDTSAPVIITSGPPSPSAASSGSWTFTAEAGATFECKLGLSGSNPAFSPCSSGATFAFPTDGTYTFTVQATDPLGNTGPPASAIHIRQAVVLVPPPPPPPPPPGTPVITSALARVGQSTSSAWSFTADPGASTFCQLSPPGPNPSGFIACSSPATYSVVTDGTYTFAVYATNASGTSATANDTYTLDTSAPAAPVIGSGPASPGTDTTPRWTFTADAESESECMLASGTTVIATWEPCSGSESYRLSDAGSYVFSVRSRDAAGNTSPTSSAVYVFQPVSRGATGPTGPPPAPPVNRPTTPPAEPAPEGPTPAGPTPSGPTPAVPVTPPAPGLNKTGGAPASVVDPGSGARPTQPVPLAGPRSAPASVVVPAAAPTLAPAATVTPTPAQQVPTAPAETFTRNAPAAPSPAPGVTPRSLIATAVAPATTSTQNQGQAVPPPGPSELDAGDESAAPPALLPSQTDETVAETILDVGVEAVKKSAFPFLLLLIVFLFLVVQDRIDRRDPKLAMAPVYRDAALSFTPPPTWSPPRHD